MQDDICHAPNRFASRVSEERRTKYPGPFACCETVSVFYHQLRIGALGCRSVRCPFSRTRYTLGCVPHDIEGLMTNPTAGASNLYALLIGVDCYLPNQLPDSRFYVLPKNLICM
jgi:hypothetical protein